MEGDLPWQSSISRRSHWWPIHLESWTQWIPARHRFSWSSRWLPPSIIVRIELSRSLEICSRFLWVEFPWVASLFLSGSLRPLRCEGLSESRKPYSGSTRIHPHQPNHMFQGCVRFIRGCIDGDQDSGLWWWVMGISYRSVMYGSLIVVILLKPWQMGRRVYRIVRWRLFLSTLKNGTLSSTDSMSHVYVVPRPRSSSSHRLVITHQSLYISTWQT